MSLLPVIAIVGRPNVGKSTLFNALTNTRDALVLDMPGVTRDRLYGHIQYSDEQKAILIDTGGLEGKEVGIASHMVDQTLQAIAEADLILFLVDWRAGLALGDEEIAQQLRQYNKKTLLVVNKIDGLDEKLACSDFYQLGFNAPVGIAASHRRGTGKLVDALFSHLDTPQVQDEAAADNKSIKISLIGRPNVGKSTLLNRLLGETRVVVYDQPGTTRDSIYVPFTRDDQDYTLIDTAGMRRRAKVDTVVEKFSIVKTCQAIADSHVVIVVLDAQLAITDQDCHLVGYALQAGRAMVIAINKWDNLTHDQRKKIMHEMERKLHFVPYVRVKKISALHGTGVGDLFDHVKEAYFATMKTVSTSELTSLLGSFVEKHPPPTSSSGRRIKLRYAHMGGHNPPTIIIHGKMTKSLPASYQRYLENQFRAALRLVGTPVRMVFKDSENPYVTKT